LRDHQGSIAGFPPLLIPTTARVNARPSVSPQPGIGIPAHSPFFPFAI
jgi:hypothetical protein